jgi:integrase
VASRDPVLAAQSSLTDRDLRLLGWLYDHGVLTTPQITKALFGSATFAQRRLLRLQSLRMVDRFRPQRPDGGSFPYHYLHAVDDRLYALYHLIVFTGLRRGEACGVHWDDVDLDAKTLTVRWQIVQNGWATEIDTPKTDDSDATVALDTTTVGVLRAHRTRQRKEKLAAGGGWTPSQLVFTTVAGKQLHPADVTDHFHDLANQAGLPPIRLHDLRHGTATLGLAAGVDMKVISGQLRHSDPHFTAATYAHILPELAHNAAEATAAMVPLRRAEDASTR